MQPETMRLGTDGELLPEHAIDTEDQPLPDKRKGVVPNPDKIVLWDRPYADPAGNTSVEIFIDYILHGWYWHLFMWRDNGTNSPRRDERTGGPCDTTELAIEEAKQCYRDRLTQAIESQEKWNDWADKNTWVVVLALLIILGILVALLLRSYNINLFPR
jgi:hypothetical protein